MLLQLGRLSYTLTRIEIFQGRPYLSKWFKVNHLRQYLFVNSREQLAKQQLVESNPVQVTGLTEEDPISLASRYAKNFVGGGDLFRNDVQLKAKIAQIVERIWAFQKM